MFFSVLTGGLGMAAGWGLAKLFMSNDYSKIRNQLKNDEFCIKNLVIHTEKQDSLLEQLAKRINNLQTKVQQYNERLVDDLAALSYAVYANEITGQLSQIITGYTSIYIEGKAGKMSASFLNPTEKQQAFERVSKVLPDGFTLLTTDIHQFNNLPVKVVEDDDGFYVIVSHPIYKEAYMFNSYLFHNRPIMVRDNLYRLKPTHEIIAISNTKVYGEKPFIEVDQSTLRNDCMKVLNVYVCPHFQSYQTNSSSSCLYNLYKPNDSVTDLPSICPTFLLPRKQYVCEIATSTFKFFYPESLTVDTFCPGSEDPIQQNLRQPDNILKIDSTCEIKLSDRIIRPAKLIDLPSSSNPYIVRPKWFNSLIEQEPHYPQNFSGEINVNSIREFREQFANTMKTHPIVDNKEDDFDLYGLLVDLGPYLIIAFLSIGAMLFFCCKKKTQATHEKPSKRKFDFGEDGEDNAEAVSNDASSRPTPTPAPRNNQG